MSTRHCLRWHYMCRPILKIYQLCALLSLLVICCLIEILLAVPEWEREWMGITSGNGNKTRLNLGLGMGMGINYWEWEEMGLKKIFPLIFTALYSMPVCLWSSADNKSVLTDRGNLVQETYLKFFSQQLCGWELVSKQMDVFMRHC